MYTHIRLYNIPGALYKCNSSYDVHSQSNYWITRKLFFIHYTHLTVSGARHFNTVKLAFRKARATYLLGIQPFQNVSGHSEVRSYFWKPYLSFKNGMIHPSKKLIFLNCIYFQRWSKHSFLACMKTMVCVLYLLEQRIGKHDVREDQCPVGKLLRWNRGEKGIENIATSFFFFFRQKGLKCKVFQPDRVSDIEVKQPPAPSWAGSVAQTCIRGACSPVQRELFAARTAFKTSWWWEQSFVGVCRCQTARYSHGAHATKFMTSINPWHYLRLCRGSLTLAVPYSGSHRLTGLLWDLTLMSCL